MRVATNLNWMWLFSVVSFASPLPHKQEAEYIIRPTKFGNIRGHTLPFDDDSNMHLDVFVGIPYATPPVGELRWTRPVEPPSWNGTTLDTLQYSSCCVQVLDNIRKKSFGPDFNDTGEDCLYLNVFAPRQIVGAGASLQVPFAVMVWVHGGSHRYGCGEEFDGRVLAQQGVVVVTLNYRLGVLGFLSSDDEVAPGNFGLLDVVQALRWVQENIANFGGDPDRVTIFGNSAGGALVSHLLFTPMTEGLFHRVIPQSGDALSPWSMVRPPYRARYWAEQLAEVMECPGNDSLAMVQCLRTKDANLLVSTPVSSGTDFTGSWIPRQDDYLIVGLPEDRLESGDFHRAEMLTGTVPGEMAELYLGVPGIEDGFDRAELESRLYDWSRRFVDHADQVYEAIKHEYDWPGYNHGKFRDLLIEMRTDDGYIGPHNRHAQVHSSHVTNTFLYSFEYRSPLHPDPEWMGVPHFEECYYIFGVPFWGARPAAESCPWGCRNTVWYNRQQEWLQENELVSRNMMDTWVSFANTGDPSTPAALWRPFNVSGEFHTQIHTNFTESQYYKYHRVRFVNSYRPTLLQIDV